MLCFPTPTLLFSKLNKLNWILKCYKAVLDGVIVQRSEGANMWLGECVLIRVI